MKRVVLMLALFASPAFADLVSPDMASCQGLSAGAECTIAAGGSGTCVETLVVRRDSNHQEKTLVCKAAMATSRKFAWVGIGLAFITLFMALRKRGNSLPT